MRYPYPCFLNWQQSHNIADLFFPFFTCEVQPQKLIFFLKKIKIQTPIFSLTLYFCVYVFIYFLSPLSHSKHPTPTPYLKPTEYSKGFSKFQPLEWFLSFFFLLFLVFFVFPCFKDLEFVKKNGVWSGITKWRSACRGDNRANKQPCC